MSGLAKCIDRCACEESTEDVDRLCAILALVAQRISQSESLIPPYLDGIGSTLMVTHFASLFVKLLKLILTTECWQR